MNFLDQISGRYGTDYASEFIELINSYAPEASRFLEWGSGESTKFICEIAACRQDPIVISIDHVPEYQRTVADSVKKFPFLHFRCMDLQGPSYSQADAGASYSSYPALLGIKFDVIFIDGRRRTECALTAAQIISDEGIVIVHDWRRSRYQMFRPLYDTVLEGKQFLVLKVKRALLGEAGKQSPQSKVVLVPARGRRSERELEWTFPSIKDYATRIGADCFTFGKDSTTPPHRLKGEALEIATHYDRALLLDADVIIRKDSPDIFEIVPENLLGAYPEGRHFSRQDWCDEIRNIYNMSSEMQSHDYFNTGVMVLSKHNYHLLEGLRTDVVYGHPQFEQGFLNAKRIELGIQLYMLSPDFNYIPDAEIQPIDWRNAFFYHTAGSGKKQFKFKELWESAEPNLKSFTRRKYLGADNRIFHIMQTCAQLNGKETYIFDATDFHYHNALALPIYDNDGNVVVNFTGNQEYNSYPLAMFGPYVLLGSGIWQVEFFTPDNTPFVYPEAKIDISSDGGKRQIFGPRDWPQDGKFTFELERDLDEIEVRIYSSHANHKLSHMRLEKVGDKDPS